MHIEWASWGIMVIANGEPNGSGSETAAWNTEAINWITQNAGKGKYAQVDASRIGVAGQSCGGLEAYTAGTDRRITSVGIFNSGALQAGQKSFPRAVAKPIAYFLGGSSDIAYNQVSCSYHVLQLCSNYSHKEGRSGL